MRFFPFGCIWNRFGTPRNSKQNGTNWCNKCKSSCRDVFLEFFTTNTLDPHHWTLNTCFGAFFPVWVHLELFRYYTKLEAKRDKLVQLMQQFVPRCFVRIFRNECSRSTPLDQNSCFCVFHSVCVHLAPFCYNTKLAAKRAKQVQLMQKFVPRCLVRIIRNEHPRPTQLDPKLRVWCVSFHLGAFGTVLLLHKICCNMSLTSAINAKDRAAMSC